uniref:Uncharacterized protein n=1 Tax=Arundo donax TaxID=35708 RepID=A0A0A9BIL4_ARUDO
MILYNLGTFSRMTPLFLYLSTPPSLLRTI